MIFFVLILKHLVYFYVEDYITVSNCEFFIVCNMWVSLVFNSAWETDFAEYAEKLYVQVPPGRIKIYCTSGCPQNQNKCWKITGFSFPIGLKNIELKLWSRIIIVIPLASTGIEKLYVQVPMNGHTVILLVNVK